MFIAKLRKRGRSFVVTVPRKEVQRLRLQEGQSLFIELQTADDHPRLAPDLEAVFDDVFRKSEPALRYLADH